MPVTLGQATEQLDTELRKAREELARYEAIKGRIWQEVAEAKDKAALELAALKKQTEQEKARIVADLPSLRQQEAAIKTTLEACQKEMARIKQETSMVVNEARQTQRQAEADAKKVVDDANAKLNTVKRQFQEFVSALPPAL